MSIESILTAIDQQIANLEHVRKLLATTPVTTKKRLGRPPATAKNISAHATTPGKRKKRKMSAEGRARIVAAQKARWAKIRKSSKA
jgi:hypothetical protein